MEKDCDRFLKNIDLQIQSKHLLKHPFYQAWSEGELSIDCLKDYAKEYYQHVKAFPTYLSAVHSRTDDVTIRRTLLQNLIEEEAGSPNHPELWKNFALALGTSEEELLQHTPSAAIQDLISTLRHICSKQTTVEGLSALYAYESQIPEICISKIEGLKKYYGLHDLRDFEYFTIHIDADKEHAFQERELLKSTINTNNQNAVYAAVDKTLDALWNFLSTICQRHQIACIKTIA